jgi:hypothetical protein
MKTLWIGHETPASEHKGLIIMHRPPGEEKKTLIALDVEESRLLFNGVFNYMADQDKEWLKQYFENGLDWLYK